MPIGACNFGTSADRNAGKKSALRSLAIACDYMETTLFAIACDLRFAIRDRLRSSAIIWKPALRNDQGTDNVNPPQFCLLLSKIRLSSLYVVIAERDGEIYLAVSF